MLPETFHGFFLKGDVSILMVTGLSCVTCFTTPSLIAAFKKFKIKSSPSFISIPLPHWGHGLLCHFFWKLKKL